MCIVAIKPAGVQRPTREQFETMCQSNPNGFGMVTWSPKTGLVVKKTMNMNEYLNWTEKVDINTPAIFHMRIATHGSVNVNNCHPFLSDDKRWAFAHNGVLSIANEGDMTDSETFFRRIALPIINAGYVPDTEMFDCMVNAVIGSSKFAFMDANGEIYHYGNFINDGGLLFSNSSYIPFGDYFGYTTTQPFVGNDGYGYDDLYDYVFNETYEMYMKLDGRLTFKKAWKEIGKNYYMTKSEYRELFNDFMLTTGSRVSE